MPSADQLYLRLEAIELAIASGADSVSYDGKSVNYMTLAEMRSVRSELRAALGLTGGRIRRTVAGYRSGLSKGERD